MNDRGNQEARTVELPLPEGVLLALIVAGAIALAGGTLLIDRHAGGHELLFWLLLKTPVGVTLIIWFLGSLLARRLIVGRDNGGHTSGFELGLGIVLGALLVAVLLLVLASLAALIIWRDAAPALFRAAILLCVTRAAVGFGVCGYFDLRLIMLHLKDRRSAAANQRR